MILQRGTMECSVSQANMTQLDMEPMLSQTFMHVLLGTDRMCCVPLTVVTPTAPSPSSENGVHRTLSNSATYYARCFSQGWQTPEYGKGDLL